MIFNDSTVKLPRTYRVPIIAPILDVVIALCKAFPANLILLICIMVYTNTFNDVIKALHLKITIRDVNLIYIPIFDSYKVKKWLQPQ